MKAKLTHGAVSIDIDGTPEEVAEVARRLAGGMQSVRVVKHEPCPWPHYLPMPPPLLPVPVPATPSYRPNLPSGIEIICGTVQ